MESNYYTNMTCSRFHSYYNVFFVQYREKRNCINRFLPQAVLEFLNENEFES